MEGGLGNDTYYVDNPGDRVIEPADAGAPDFSNDTVFSSVSFTLANNVENLTLTGIRNINGTGNDESGLLAGNIGNNKLIGGTVLYGDMVGDTDGFFSRLSGDAHGGNDFLYGGAGDDFLWGDSVVIEDSARGGNDHLIGGEGQDYLYGDASFMYGNARGGNDYLDGGPQYGFPSGNFLSGDCSEMGGNARGGNDYLNGGPGYGTLSGDADAMDGNSQGGNDYLDGRAGSYTLSGDSRLDMRDDARGGNDHLSGGAYSDILYGDAAAMGGKAHGGNDYLDGGGGDDVLYGDAAVMGENARGGDDCLRGGSGHDIFGFAGGDEFTPGDGTFGHDVVLDFHQGEDRLEFDRFDAVQSIADLQIVQHGHDTVITVPNHGTVELLGVTATLTASDFIFVA